MVNISVTAGYIASMVIAVRYLFRKAPARLILILWLFVALRLIFPVSIESDISLIPSGEMFEQNLLDEGNGDFYINSGIDPLDETVNGYMSERYFEGVTVRYNFKNDLADVLSVIWLAGTGVLVSGAVYAYIRLKRRLMTATMLYGNIRMSEYVTSPFVMGILSPKIYIPYGLSGNELQTVLAHETEHIKRKDHLWKIFAYFLLCVYWFNPVLWISYSFFCRDLELACDEAVLRDSDDEMKREYSRTLLSLGTDKNHFSACPLAFGETGIKERVSGIMNKKKPTKLITALSVFTVLFFLVFFTTVPPSMGIEDIDVWTENIFEDAEYVYVVSAMREYILEDEKSIKNALEELKKIEINSQEISKSLSEDRPMNNIIVLGDNVLCFDETFTGVWINNPVKPSFTYRVKNPGFVKETFFEGSFAGSEITNPLRGEIVSVHHESGVLRYELRNSSGEYYGILITPDTGLSFTDKDDEFIISDITGGRLWDGIGAGAYISVKADRSDEYENYIWLYAEDCFTAGEITVNGFDENYFLSDGE